MRLSPVVLAALACALARPLAADLADVQARGRLDVLYVPGSPEYVDAGGTTGFDVEVLAGFARLHRIEAKWAPVPSWEALLPALNAGKGDLAAGGITVTDARRKVVRFTAEVFPSRGVLVTRRPHRVLRTMEELRTEKVGTIRGTSMAEMVALANVPAANLDDSFPSGALPKALREGRITATVLGVEDALVARRADPALQLGGFIGPRQGLAFAVRPADEALREALSTYIGNLRRTPSWNRLVVKYFGELAPEILREAQKE
jgi:ABC-type amino acid transport substrate-binding protein